MITIAENSDIFFKLKKKKKKGEKRKITRVENQSQL